MGDTSLIAIVEALLQLSMIIMVGLYFTFSNTVMLALSTRRDGANTMIEINRQILNPLFLACFFLSGFAGLYFFVSHSGFQSIAGLVFVIGTTLVTAVYNVPLNNRLRDASKDTLPHVWQAYLAKWVFWNHVRTASAVSSGFFISV
ncbi:DUF1772 domain-containing protein [Thalassotalea euphylliae]|uniref:anthrone oxygenase family protein n=1 Tax=Thalassotalea euphylliae TaxID=1655234 RepID=UPI003624FE9E